MNLTALKNFAPNVRRQLIEAVGRKLDFVLTGDTPDLRERAKQRLSIKAKAEKDRPGLIERVAYTWFNRLAALRFLDARGWHPFLCRVITPFNEGETQPEILKLTRNGALPAELGPFTNPVRINDLLDGRIPSADPQGEVYRHLVLAACRYYHNLMPFLFEALDDETELLLPDDLLTEHSVAQGFRSAIIDDDCAEVEIIGWLYQFYIAEKKDQVMARKSAVPTEDIPAVTQLFTPHWIVRYLVENSLGRLWLLNRPGSQLRKHMPYYIEGEPETGFLKVTKVEEIRLLDPATGSGHMLTYSFDLLYLIYEEEGHAPSEIPGLILSHNLFGLEICPRATQLAQFALVCKAREKSRVAFRNPIQPQVMCLEDVEIASQEMTDYLRLPSLRELFTEKVLRQVHQFRENTSAFGSLIQPRLPAEEITTLKSRLAKVNPGDDLLRQETHRKVLRTLDQAEMLSQRYHVVVANPPYMGGKGMNGSLKSFLRDNYTDVKSDLFSAFIVRNTELALAKGQLGFVTPYVWLFLSSYEKLREYILLHCAITSLIQLEYNAFEPACIPVCTFTLSNQKNESTGVYIRLSDFRGCENQNIKTLEAITNPECGWYYRTSQKNFKCIIGTPIAYWISDRIRSYFTKSKKIEEYAYSKQGLATANNDRFLRKWHEVSIFKLNLPCSDISRTVDTNKKWYPHQKGGLFRRWYGNNEYVVNWEKNGSEIRAFGIENGGRPRSRVQNSDFYFKSGITWSDLTITKFSGRHFPQGFIFDITGPALFAKKENYHYKIISFVNSKLYQQFLDVSLSGMHYSNGVIAKMPCLISHEKIDISENIAHVAINISKSDWDSYETSWDFASSPLLNVECNQSNLKDAYQKLRGHWQEMTLEMLRLEEENNRIFIEAYGLMDELTPNVSLNEITLTGNPHYHYGGNKSEEEMETLLLADTMKEFISYAVGCMMGRYSLEAPGLILADAGDNLEQYLAKVSRPLDQLTFPPDSDAILPVLDDEWFEDDIVARSRDFLRVTFGEATLEENLRFIEKSLGKDLRKYFLTDFYKDHIQTYKKRPIYWLFQSPKKGFSALIYLHRYTRDTVNVLLNSYLRDYLHKLRSRIEHLEHVQATGENTREKTAARKESDTLKKTLHECEEYERDILLPLAQQRIELDLDDGVKVNYFKFGKALAAIPGLAAKEEEG